MLISVFKNFTDRAIGNMPAGAIALMTVLIAEFNRYRWQPELKYSERELAHMAGMGNSSVHRHLQFLQSKGFIQLQARGRFTVITLEQNWSRGGADMERSSEFPITRAHVDIEDKVDPPPPPEPAVEDDKSELEELVEDWQDDPQMPKLFFEHESHLKMLVESKRASPAQIREAITRAKDRNRPDKYGRKGLNWQFILLQIEKVIKGEKINDRQSTTRRERVPRKVAKSYEYAEPRTDKDPDWRAALLRRMEPRTQGEILNAS